MGHQGDRQVCIRAGAAETVQVPHKQASVAVEAKGKGLKRQVLCGKVQREVDEEREDITPETDACKLEREESGLWAKITGRREWNITAVANAIERELIKETYPIIMKSQEGSPVGGSKRATTTRDARGGRSQKRRRRGGRPEKEGREKEVPKEGRQQTHPMIEL